MLPGTAIVRFISALGQRAAVELLYERKLIEAESSRGVDGKGGSAGASLGREESDDRRRGPRRDLYLRRVDSSQLAKFSLTSNDSCGTTYKEARRTGEQVMTYEWRTYWDGMAGGTEEITPPANGYFYDELPWLVRTIDFSKREPFEIHLSGTTINSKKDSFNFQPAKISFTANERTIEVTVEHARGRDLFTLDRDPPHLLREWKAADGSHLKMKRNLKVDYWNYNKPGDRERALNNPMLRLPD